MAEARRTRAVQRTKVDTWDAEGWKLLIQECMDPQCPIEEARGHFKEAIAQFPSASRFWIQYINLEAKRGSEEEVERLFVEALTGSNSHGACVSLDMFDRYIYYLRKKYEEAAQNPSNLETMLAARGALQAAYELALDKLGSDIESDRLWRDAISFTRGAEGDSDRGARIAATRRLFHRALATPIRNLEIWKEYDRFEFGLNRTLAKNLVSNQAKHFYRTQSILRDRLAHVKGIQRSMLAVPATHPPSTSILKAQYALWCKWIDFEASDPQRLDDPPEEDQVKASDETLHQRMCLVYEQALLPLYRLPAMWVKYARYMEAHDPVVALDILARASKACPSSSLVTLTRAYALEKFERVTEARTCYSTYVEQGDVSADDAALVYVHFMQFALRIDGKKASRAVFKASREDEKVKECWQIYVCAALLEFHANQDQRVALRIFNLGMERFSSNADFVMEYIQFMVPLNDTANLRSLFERVLSDAAATDVQPIWDHYLSFESFHGDIRTLERLEKRRADTYPHVNKAHGLMALDTRFSFKGLSAMPPLEREACGLTTVPTRTTTVSTVSRASGDALDTELVRMTGVVQDTEDVERAMTLLRATKGVIKLPRPQFSKFVRVASETRGTKRKEDIRDGIPAKLHDLLSALPNPRHWRGPTFYVNQILHSIQNTALPKQHESTMESKPRVMDLFQQRRQKIKR